MLEFEQTDTGGYECAYRHGDMRETLVYAVEPYRRPGIVAWQGYALREGDVVAAYEPSENLEEVLAWAERTAAKFESGRPPL